MQASNAECKPRLVAMSVISPECHQQLLQQSQRHLVSRFIGRRQLLKAFPAAIKNPARGRAKYCQCKVLKGDMGFY